MERLQFTELDRALIRHGGPRGLVTIDGPPLRPQAALAFRQQELRRLQVLEGLGLAEKIWTRTWRLSPQLEDALRQAQLSGDIIKARARHQARLSDPRLPVALTRIEAGTAITGRVVGTGLADELRDQRYLLVEASDRLRDSASDSRIRRHHCSITAPRDSGAVPAVSEPSAPKPSLARRPRPSSDTR